MAKQKKIEELNQIYTEADEVDQEIFSEQRSNILLVAGDHYNRRTSKFWNRVRDSKELSSEQKLRLTQNHTQKITKNYVNNILTYAPGVVVTPKSDSELQDMKAAELNNSVWQDAQTRLRVRTKIRQWAEDYVNIGEAAVKIYWNPSIGKYLGEEPTEEEGKTRPKFSGDFEFERIFGFNLLRPKEAKELSTAHLLINRKMVDKKVLTDMVGDDETKKKYIQDSAEEAFVVFDGSKSSYSKSSKNEVMLREYFYRPCVDYPKGYFYITTSSGILFEGELPFGVYPILTVGFDELQTSPRSRSIVKQLRPYQGEINRMSSKAAEHQITVGDDKIVYAKGSKLEQGALLPGIRGISVQGSMSPTIIPGRAGDQYLPHISAKISEMYMIANMEEDSAEREGQLDAYALLFRSLRNKKKFSIYAEKFELFLCDVCETFLDLSRYYYSEEMIIPMIGRREQVNISEFKNTTKLCYQVKVEPRSNDIETQMGKQLAMNHLLQFGGQQLAKEDIGKILKNMPMANIDETFDDLTINYDNAKNDMLALERGDMPIVNANDDHAYVISRLTNRMRQADFKMLAQPIQQAYQTILGQHEQIMADQEAARQRAQSGYIPTGGYMVVVDLYVSDTENPMKTKRARIPYESVAWLLKKLEDQGTVVEQMDGLPMGVQASLSDRISASLASGQGAPNGMGSPALMNGAATPRGAMNGGTPGGQPGQ